MMDLRATLAQCAVTLDEIKAAIQDFTHEAPASDHLTPTLAPALATRLADFAIG